MLCCRVHQKVADSNMAGHGGDEHKRAVEAAANVRLAGRRVLLQICLDPIDRSLLPRILAAGDQLAGRGHEGRSRNMAH